jgi:N-carbamoylputrescine amidase
MTAPRTLRVAAVQVESRNLDVEGNLRRAESLVADAGGRGAELVLCPELLAAGYVYDAALWNAGEPRGGPTESWLARMARRHGIYIGASYLEASGDDFFNTFTLMKPDGLPAGRVRKQSLPGFEGWFIRGGSGPSVIPTELGRIGVGICHDNATCRFMRGLSREQPDLLLMPHSAPLVALGPLPLVRELPLVGERGCELLRNLPGFYARSFSIPVVMANKAAGRDTISPVPWVPLLRLKFHFVGQSTICDAAGNVCDRLDEREGVAIADVTLAQDRNRPPPQTPGGYWSNTPPFLPRFPRTAAAVFRVLECTGRAAYRLSQSRRSAARNCGRARPCAHSWSSPATPPAADGAAHRFEAALADAQPYAALHALARALKAEGIDQVSIYRLFREYLVKTDSNDRRYDAIADNMDLIRGGPWAKGGALFERELTDADVA